MDDTLPETAALRALRSRFSEGGLQEGAGSWAMLIDAFRGSEHEPVMMRAQVSASDFGPTEAEAGHQFDQMMLALRIKRVNEEIESLKQASATRPELGIELARRTRELAELRKQRV